jgi:CYTH domain-containing protein
MVIQVQLLMQNILQEVVVEEILLVDHQQDFQVQVEQVVVEIKIMQEQQTLVVVEVEMQEEVEQVTQADLV